MQLSDLSVRRPVFAAVVAVLLCIDAETRPTAYSFALWMVLVSVAYLVLARRGRTALPPAASGEAE